MTERPQDPSVGIKPVEPMVVDAMWATIRERLPEKRRGFAWGWVVASAIAFVSLSAGAAVIVMRMTAPAPAPVTHVDPPARAPRPAEAPAPAVLPEPVVDTPEAPRTKRKPPAPALVQETPPPPAVVETKPDPPPPVDAFREANEARSAGDLRRALAAYERFVNEHPTDARAPLAAMELCRIAADQLDDAALALSWAERTLALGARSAVREDARSREVQLLGKTGRSADCLTKQTEFLRDYPRSIHHDRVQRACKAN